MKTRTQRLRMAAGLAATVGLMVLSGCGGKTVGGGGSGDTWKPNGSVTMVVPFSAGGGSDLAGRASASGLEKAGDGAKINVENREGGSGAVGYAYFVSKKGDPQYLLATETSLLTLPLTQKVPFTYETFTPIMKLGEDYTLAVVAANSPYKTCNDVVAAAKKTRIIVGISGQTGLDNIVFSLTEKKMGVKFDRVPFESGAELTAALLGGQVKVASLNPGEIIGQIKAKKVRPICAYADKRYDYPDLKNIPTAKEQGIDVSFAQFRGVLAPAGITDEQKSGWIEVAKKFGDSADYKKYVEENYLQPNKAYGDDFTSYLKQNNDLLKPIIGS